MDPAIRIKALEECIEAFEEGAKINQNKIKELTLEYNKLARKHDKLITLVKNNVRKPDHILKCL